MIVLGRIIAPFGVRGWLRVHPFGDDPLKWQHMPRWWISPDVDAADENWRACVPEAVRMHSGKVVAKLVDVDDRSGAEVLAGCFVGAMRNELPSTGKDEYYWQDLIGLSVVNLQGESLGNVVTLLETGANDVLVVKDGDRERLLPFIENVVKRVDMTEGMVHVDWDSDW
jgi:16S rRNA processing protein RimM